ncbi:hypothetical protein GO003_012300 [Methylicorpusculum oleiharenae]|uniref:hypothetical protein n=1 Tax=Methylicorpusculum oleiharenae TaxID=1338687 RepID=UPI00135998F3|nr:hypothetical protein [Methylicorpusculum oleiharenae]MCD2451173.1 hypothetical protein [Methylicorpusculum oleiharenae]
MIIDRDWPGGIAGILQNLLGNGLLQQSHGGGLSIRQVCNRSPSSASFREVRREV